MDVGLYFCLLCKHKTRKALQMPFDPSIADIAGGGSSIVFNPTLEDPYIDGVSLSHGTYFRF